MRTCCRFCLGSEYRKLKIQQVPRHHHMAQVLLRLFADQSGQAGIGFAMSVVACRWAIQPWHWKRAECLHFLGFMLALEDLLPGSIQLVSSFWVAGAPSQEHLLRRCERLLELLGCKYYFYSWIHVGLLFWPISLEFRRPKSSNKKKAFAQEGCCIDIVAWILLVCHDSWKWLSLEALDQNFAQRQPWERHQGARPNKSFVDPLLRCPVLLVV